MADIFISYARTERSDAERIARRLESMELSVFLDVDGLDGGDVFSEKLDREVKTAGVVLGLWSPSSLARPWVQIECDIGKRRGVLVPVAIHPFRDMDVPAPFWNIQFVDLTDLSDDEDDPNWLKLRRALARTLKRPDLIPVRTAPAVSPRISAGTATRTNQRQRSRGPTLTLVLSSLSVLVVVTATAGVLWLDPLHWRAPQMPVTPVLSVVPPPSAVKPASAAPTTPESPESESAVASPAPLHSVRFESIRLINTEDWRIREAYFSPDGSKVVSLSQTADRDAAIWDLATGKSAQDLPECGELVRPLIPMFSPNGSVVATGSALNDTAQICLVDLASGRVLTRFETPGTVSLRFGFSGELLATDGYVWNTKTGAQVSKLEGGSRGDLIAFSRDESLIASAGWGGSELAIWDARSGKLKRTITVPSYGRGLAFSPDGKTLAYGSIGGTARIYDVSTGAQVGKLVHPGGVVSVWYSNDGRMLLTCGSDGLTRLWNLSTGEVVAEAKGGSEWGYAEMSRDETKMLVVTDAYIRIYRIVRE